MLVLSRRVGESIKIGDGITIIVNRINGKRVTLGLEAPRNMRIVRGELKPLDKPELPETAAAARSESSESTSLGIALESSVLSHVARRAR